MESGEKSRSKDYRREQSRFRPMEALCACKEIGKGTSGSRRVGRHLAFVERWPETRREEDVVLPLGEEEEERKKKEAPLVIAFAFILVQTALMRETKGLVDLDSPLSPFLWHFL
ncbi:hypothetical protein JCGZ_10337 [Jatropha curcas]|uniref:Uncharacterized protein n=1 Tax=Jatropha curcas TaxID=180498 RepID=A0A067KK36_JATCU|nr:hypothetical protein JCGZ_10337 [Jatropha curcas]